MIHLATHALDGFVDDLPTSSEPGQADVLVLGSGTVDLGRFPRLRAIFRAGVGAENVPLEAARARGIEVVFPSQAAAALLYDEVASFTVHLVLKAAYARAGSLDAWSRSPRPDLATRRLLVVGAGHIGSRVAERMRPFLHVTTFDARRPRSELHQQLSEADVVSLHLPLAENTRGLLGADELARLPDGAALVNTARAALVDEQALLAEIRSGRLRAAFDVFWQEPYRGPLAAFHPDRFHMTPHVAGAGREFLEAEARELRALLARVARG